MQSQGIIIGYHRC